MVEFVSYDGEYPYLCMGTLVLNIDEKDVTFPDYCMRSGGSVWFDEDWSDHVEEGPWNVDCPKEYEHLCEEIETCVNKHVPCGCCGGCV